MGFDINSRSCPNHILSIRLERRRVPSAPSSRRTMPPQPLLSDDADILILRNDEVMCIVAVLQPLPILGGFTFFAIFHPYFIVIRRSAHGVNSPSN